MHDVEKSLFKVPNSKEPPISNKKINLEYDLGMMQCTNKQPANCEQVNKQIGH